MALGRDRPSTNTGWVMATTLAAGPSNSLALRFSNPKNILKLRIDVSRLPQQERIERDRKFIHFKNHVKMMGYFACKSSVIQLKMAHFNESHIGHTCTHRISRQKKTESKPQWERITVEANGTGRKTRYTFSVMRATKRGAGGPHGPVSLVSQGRPISGQSALTSPLHNAATPPNLRPSADRPTPRYFSRTHRPTLSLTKFGVAGTAVRLFSLMKKYLFIFFWSTPGHPRTT